MALLLVAGANGATHSQADWPQIHSAIRQDPAQESRIAAIVAQMTLAQKIGQMTQPEIKFITPDEVKRFYIGSVLNGGGSWPGNDKQASASDWLQLADAYWAASMATDAAVKLPLIWGTDAVHGHNNVRGATLFPHNIGLGATADAKLVEAIGAATAKAVRATGIQWVFAPTLAVAQDMNWGRSYESYSADPALVARLGAAYVRGLQGQFKDDANVVATAKHFLGDGGTDQGRDQGVTLASREQMIAIHLQGYVGAIGAGAQTVMASFNSWNDVKQGVNYGKMHGSRALLTDVLKTAIGFDGFVVSDWNGIGQIPGCSNASCAQAINAGIDMVMVPEEWRAFIKNTMLQVERGEIPIARIDDAVSRILRVKLRAGLFEQSPGRNAWAGRADALQDRALARRAVRQSLVLLKNQQQALPLRAGQRLLVVGNSADSLENQSGGWSRTWQGNDNKNSDFPAGQTILSAVRAAAGEGQVSFSKSAAGVDLKAFDAVIAVIGETPYAEGNGDIPASGTLRHSSRYPQDLALLNAVSGKGPKVITVFVAGRPLYTNDLLNRSDAFVMAWLPGTEGGGVADLLFASSAGADFSGRLPFPWPQAACAGGTPLFAAGYGLAYGAAGEVGRLAEHIPSGGCGARNEIQIFRQAAVPPYTFEVGSAVGRWQGRSIPDDPNQRLALPAQGAPDVEVSTVQIHTQQDAKRIAWSGPARFSAWGLQKTDLGAFPEAALLFDSRVEQPPQAPVTLTMICGSSCQGSLDLTDLFKRMASQPPRTIKIALACFAARGVLLNQVEVPWRITTTGPFIAAFANIRIAAGAARDADALPCNSFPISP